MTIVTDASPYGMGGFLVYGCVAIGYFIAAITDHDRKVLEVIDDERGQQRWEALAILIALRMWRSFWMDVRVTLTVKSDNMSALTFVNDLRAKGGGLRTIACELALDLAESSFEPDLAVHTPGVCNDVADALSRYYDPARAHSWQLPPALVNAKRCTPPCRDQRWWKTLADLA